MAEEIAKDKKRKRTSAGHKAEKRFKSEEDTAVNSRSKISKDHSAHPSAKSGLLKALGQIDARKTVEEGHNGAIEAAETAVSGKKRRKQRHGGGKRKDELAQDESAPNPTINPAERVHKGPGKSAAKKSKKRMKKAKKRDGEEKGKKELGNISNFSAGSTDANNVDQGEPSGRDPICDCRAKEHRPEQCIKKHPELVEQWRAKIDAKIDEKKERKEKKAELHEARMAKEQAKARARKDGVNQQLVKTGQKLRGEKIKRVKPAGASIHQTQKMKKYARVAKPKAQELVIVENGAASEREDLAISREADQKLWNVSKPAGGRFLVHDPVFSLDEEHIFLATKRGIYVYSTSTSLLVQTLASNYLDRVAGYALSISNPNHLYVANLSGSVVLWNWKTGCKLWVAPKKWPIRAIAVTQLVDTDYDTVFTTETEQHPKNGPTDHVIARQFYKGATTATAVSLWRTPQTLLFLRLLNRGDVIFAASDQSVVMGNFNSGFLKKYGDRLDDPSTFPKRYIWRDQNFNELLTSFDAQARPQVSGGPTGKSNKRDNIMYDVVCGGVQGNIYIYEDFLRKVEKKEDKLATEITLTPRVIRWHREAVATVKWSLDGNYLLSGGKETVLCLWQLDTGTRTDLPHLTSAIESLTVSPRGISYAVQLADNSVMVLSTTELMPKANIPSIQSQFVSPVASLLPQVVTVALTTRDSDDPVDSFGRTPAVGNPRNINQLLLAVPASQDRADLGNSPVLSPFLQTFDIFAARHVSRQALARNNTTNINVGPEGNKIKESNVTHLQISADGQWLASVEEWMPPAADVDFAVFAPEKVADERRRRLETYLKFWRWNKELDQWVLETRVDRPHQSSTDPFSNHVFDLAVHPKSTAFSTIGEDGFTRAWRPKTRTKHGTVVRGANAEGTTAWTCAYTIELEKAPAIAEPGQDFPAPPAPTNGKLAYSNDGSILAAAQDSAMVGKAGLVQFLDAKTGAVTYSEPFMYTQNLAGMGFLGHYFVILSDDIRVWDVVASKLAYGTKLQIPGKITTRQQITMSHLAINTTSNTFAVAVPAVAAELWNKKPGLGDVYSTVMIFDPAQRYPLQSFDTPCPVTALVSFTESSGYVVVDSEAEFRTVSHKTAATFVASTAAIAETEPSLALEVAEEDVEKEEDEDEEEEETNAGADRGDVDENSMGYLDDEKALVRPEQLAGVFDRGPSFALPSVRDLFDSVVGLYGRKPPVASG